MVFTAKADSLTLINANQLQYITQLRRVKRGRRGRPSNAKFAQNPLALYNLSHEKRAAFANPAVRPACCGRRFLSRIDAQALTQKLRTANP